MPTKLSAAKELDLGVVGGGSAASHVGVEETAQLQIEECSYVGALGSDGERWRDGADDFGGTRV